MLFRSVDPFGGSVVEVLLLPDWHNFLERVNQEASGFEGLDPVRAADGHSDADVAEFEVSESVNDAAGGDRPFHRSD